MTAPRAPMGRFSWHDLMSTAPVDSCAFYSAVFGWRVEEMPTAGAAYVVLLLGDDDVAGIVPFSTNVGAPSHWTTYVSVPDVDETVRLAVSLGGRVRVRPTDMEGVGRLAVIADPQGAPLQLLATAPPAPQSRPELGSIPWNTLWTGDPSAAASFYAKLFGWTIRPAAFGAEDTHLVCSAGHGDFAGIARMPSELRGAIWLPHVAVDSLRGAAARIGELGGTFIALPPGMPRANRLALGVDPQGATFGLLQLPPR